MTQLVQRFSPTYKEIVMGLIDDTRKKRDSWIKRFEEQRQEEEWNAENIDREAEERKIELNRKNVGVFPPKPEVKNVN